MGAHAAAQHPQVALCGLAGLEPRAQHLACGVVDEGNQAALGGTALEPVVMAGINLHQLTQTAPPLPGAVHPLRSSGLGLPQARSRHPAAKRLGAVLKAVVARQGLARRGQRHTLGV